MEIAVNELKLKTTHCLKTCKQVVRHPRKINFIRISGNCDGKIYIILAKIKKPHWHFFNIRLTLKSFHKAQDWLVEAAAVQN